MIMINHIAQFVHILAFVALVTSSGCKKNSPNSVEVLPPGSTIPTPPGYTLVWNDEFDSTAVDGSKWGYEVNGDGGGNNELQYYTSRPENSFVKDGMLTIRAVKETYLSHEYTSARMRTAGKGDWKYGRFEVRAKVPYGQGLWPAIWMLPTDWVYGGWPASGEIDIMELLGQDPAKVYGTIHYGTAGHLQSGGSYSLPAEAATFAGAFHVFAIEWDSTSFKWFVDNTQYYSVAKTQPFDQRFHILLNVAVGGNWPGSPNEMTVFPQEMIVDYVRVFQKK
jgi:beta-glucanase (GH16 family)